MIQSVKPPIAKASQINEVVFDNSPNVDPYTWAWNLTKCITKEQATASATRMAASSAKEAIRAQEPLVMSLIERNWLKLDWAKVR